MKHIKLFEDYPKPDDEDEVREEFINYVLDYYGPDGTWSEFFDEKLTKEIILKYVDKFIRTRTKLQMWVRGDSFDREFFRDVLFIKLGIEYDTEYDVGQYLTEEERKKVEIEKNAKKYNL
jgi:hypothetical protein